MDDEPAGADGVTLGADSVSTVPWNAPYRHQMDYGPYTYDHTNRFVTSYVYNLPKLTGSNAVARGFLGNWQWSGILTGQSGDPLTITAAAGMRSRLESLDLIANNLANTSAPGFKADREQFSLYLSEETAEAQDDGTGVAQPFSPVIESHWTDTTQGELRSTGNSGDLALSGKGYFQINGEDGPLFTRDGRFTITKDGKLLTENGYEFSSTDGKPIQVDPSLPVTVDPDGTVAPMGKTDTFVKQGDVVRRAKPA